MYENFHTLEVLHREKQEELARIPFYKYKNQKVKNKKSKLCKMPIVNQLPQCQCHN